MNEPPRIYHDKINPTHLQRKAVVYLRQSTGRQVRENKESQVLQYALLDRARDLGFAEVETVDVDLGTSAGLGAKRRDGFDRLISAVAMGEVGIVFSIEVARLSRTDKDWCRLIEVCQVFGTLIGDGEQVYDPGCMDDQLVLGIKGTLSVVELNVMRRRLLAGMEKKARRGELIRTLPVGYVRDNTGKVVKDPDKRVQEVIELLFRKFREIRTIRQTFLWFRNEGIEMPVNRRGGGTVKIVWQLPKKEFLDYLFRNPFYAGVYFWGRKPVERIVVDGAVRKRQGKAIEPEECKVFIKDHHEGYIDWQTYKENRRIIRNNNLCKNGEVKVGAVREGKRLLTGLMRCGRCGRKLLVHYWGKSRTDGQYHCEGDTQNGGRRCIRFGGSTVDRRFSEELLNVISPLGMKASLEAIERLKAKNDERQQTLRRQLQQAEFEQRKAFEQYDEVDPRNRLVAAELEKRWNEKLKDIEKLKVRLKELEQQTISPTKEEREQILALGKDFELVWNSDACPASLKKKIIRTVVEEIIVDHEEKTDLLRFVIHWRGGCHTQFEMPKPKHPGEANRTALEDRQIIKEMAARYGDDRIAWVLNRLGRTTGNGNRWNETRVRYVRNTYYIRGHRRTVKDPEILNLKDAAEYCKVSKEAIIRLIDMGILNSSQIVPFAPWEIKRADLAAEPVCTIVQRLRSTGKLDLGGYVLKDQMKLFGEHR